MSYSSGPSDPLVESLNPLVNRGTLSPEQANEVYRAVSSAQSQPGQPSGDASSATGWQRPRLLAGVSVLGATLLLAALSIASANSEQSVSQVVNGTSVDESFPGKQFALMLLITLFLAAAAAASHVLLTGRPYARLISSVLAAFTLLALVTTVGSTWDAEALIYLGGIVLLVGGLAGYWLLKGQVLVPVAVAGGALFLGQLLSDTLDDSEFKPGTALLAGMVFLGYGVVVAVAGWRFSCRNVAAMFGGGIALAAMWLTVVIIGFATLFLGFSADISGDPSGPSAPSSRDDARTDMRIAMVLGLLVAVGLVLLYAYTFYHGYLVLAFVGAVSLPSTTVALTVGEHPLRWAIGFAVLGAAAAAGPLGVLWSQGGRRGQQTAEDGASPPGGPPPAGPPLASRP